MMVRLVYTACSRSSNAQPSKLFSIDYLKRVMGRLCTDGNTRPLIEYKEPSEVKMNNFSVHCSNTETRVV